MAAPRLVVLDADGTLVPEGNGSTPSDAAMQAVERIRDRTELALASGRTEPDLRKVARNAGIDRFVCELGGLVVDGDETWPAVAWDGDDPAEEIRASGVLDEIVDVFPDLSVDPYGHRVTVPVHGELSPEGIERIEAIVAGHAGLCVLDNTVAGRIVVLHVAPEGLSKAAGLAALQDRLGVEPSETIVVGDSPQDAGCHARARRVYIVGDGTAGRVEAGNVVTLDAPNGRGVAEAIGREFEI